MDINEKLKFSWGHIIALVAMIVITYFSFLGLTYLTDGNFVFAGIAVGILDALIAFVFFGAQVLKGTDKKFHKKIVRERVLVVIAPIVLAVCMFPACHFWTVFGHRTQIEDQFHSTVSSFKEMFNDYETYAQDRCDKYARFVNVSRGTRVNKQNRILALSLQLKDANYLNLKKEAIEWIDKAEDATVWNVFIIANMETIKDAVVKWNKQLVAFSSKRMSDESANVEDVKDFDSDSASLNQIMSYLDGIKEDYSLIKCPNTYAIIMFIFCYLFLMLPYFIQQRNTKSIYHLLYKEKTEGMTIGDTPKNGLSQSTEDNIEVGDIEPPKNTRETTSADDGGESDFESFTM